MSVHFIVCTVAVQAIKSVMQCSFSKRRNNMTEINKRMLSLSNVSVNYAIAHTVKEQQKCCEVCFYYLWDAEEASLQTKCGSLDRCWFMVPLLPSAPLSVFTIRLHLQGLYSIWSANHPYTHLFHWAKSTDHGLLQVQM